MSGTDEAGWAGNITPNEVREVWEGRIRPIEDDLISPRVSSPTRRFLTEVGLPSAEVLNIVFAHGSRLLNTVRQGGREYLVVTEEESDITFAIDVRSDHAFDINLSNSKYTRFINSDIASLIFFLGLLDRNVLSLQEIDEETLADAVDSVRLPLTDRDPAAMEGETPWNALLDDLETQYE